MIVIHEMPGITPLVADFADDVVERGFTVVMPDLVGTPGRAASAGYMLSSIVRMCVAREFTTLALGRTSPIVAWLRALARRLHGELGGPGVGAIGMCFSGGFALGMMIDEHTIAPVLSQPSLPMAIGSRRAAALGLSDGDVAAVADRAAAGCEVLGLRFGDDAMVGQRFATLREVLGDAFVAVELPSPHPKAHSVLTDDRDAATVERVLTFLDDRLRV